MRLSVVCISALAICATAAPLFGVETERAGPASAEAVDLAHTSFALVASSGSGCADTIAHAAVSIVPDGQSDDIEGIISFGNITVNGEVCESGADDQVLNFYSEDVLTSDIIPGGNILELSANASTSIFVAGVDKSKRKCGDWVDDELQAYYFTEDIMLVLPSLSEAGFIDNSTIPAEKLFSGGMWMASVPQDGPGLVCLYMETSKPIEGMEEADPTESPDADSVISLDEEEPQGPTTFDEANDAALADEESRASEDSKCFPSFARVQLEDGSVKTMDELEIGDRVLVGLNTFSEVFMFTHRLTSGDFDFLKLELESGASLSVTAGHYIYINGGLAAASTATIGDTLELADGSQVAIASISKISSQGLYNPQTVHGELIVDSIRVSTYTTAVQPKAAHTLLFPFRALFTGLSISVSSLENGADGLTRFVPSGPAVY